MKIQMSEITFVREIKQASCVSTFLVNWSDKLCVLRVLNRTENPPIPHQIIPHHDPFESESQAYKKLKVKGVCRLGYVPDFYGVIEDINSADHLPHLQDFLGKRLHPGAVLIEYVPNIQPIKLQTKFPIRDKFNEFACALKHIHDVEIAHGSPCPRHMMVQDGTGRTVWIGFTWARIIPAAFCTEKEKELLTLEKIQVQLHLKDWLEEQRLPAITVTEGL
ncbi:hypothetical protein BO70DRAFT_393063 [Aspergillus heteromorphus CBS 117.55]|uniref:Protein kinase domain-containing protein n=1 Tax=Aspergillus heteromorphus CBS 117.55 TaxID=1448321 RepID=A0A317WTX7_9EURO|nr:uncharacterized protein BO70DRAFT_393063 [Aspergillus heteromorphus CBS 117.55]PWY89864.1 hypothetical protein BO70DRAFT_393063 [Aspergillus heteromorphus CBS 117.55]